MSYVQPMPVPYGIPHQPMPYGLSQQPTAQGDPFRAMSKEWSSGLCNCCEDVSQCCYAYFCWPCFMCTLAGKINESTCSCLCAPNALAMYRMKVRTALHIKGDTCSDHCVAAFCGFCAGVQMQNELRYHGLA